MTAEAPLPTGSDGWLENARRRVEATPAGASTASYGEVVQLADGIVRIAGLPEVRLDALVRFESGQLGLALALEEDALNAVLLDEPQGLEAGTRVTGTGAVVRVPVGPALMGRIVDPLGRPLDDKGDIAAAEHWPIERASPAIIERDLVSRPVETGVLAMDALFALGRGQRELIVGDRSTGKTSLAIDAICNQSKSDITCVYVAVGQRASAVERAIEAVRKHGAVERCIFVVASAAAPAGLQWIAPFAGFSIAEYFRDSGGHALIVIDDMTKHAATHRELSLLMREPPGREAYPGDIFYLHARMLERAGQLSAERGGGSLTALPIAETDAGNLSAYIPTNLISITDGQIVLDAKLFAANQRPAVDVGLSVSRVGGKAQRPALRQVAGRIRLDYAQFLELEMFTRFGGISEKRFRPVLNRGQRIRAVLRQDRFAAIGTAGQVALLAALNEGALDALPVEAIPALKAACDKAVRAQLPEICKAIDAGEKLDDAQSTKLVAAIQTLAAGSGDG
ncbi:ATP synthase subunit alpha 2 [Croceicoccus mobilis]|uniref:ATP synthase subunit alpha n=2 Tax=Croceicoccus mobilis TaxID=1703339 RepID=A0A916YV33_9SPHN|nr:ATP synthase subunit alpha 2 [Croceicoccus mobilis]